MARTKTITAATTCFALPASDVLLEGAALCAGADAATMEIFEGAIDSVATFNFPNAGTGYAVGDKVTLVAGENGSAGARAILIVTQIDNNSPSSSRSSSPSSSISASPEASESPSASLSVSSSISSSPSHSASPSTSVSSSPSASASPSTSISSSPSASASPSTSISSSPSSSVSSSRSSSPSTSASPSAGSGEITAASIFFAGGGYTAGNTYATTTDGSGISATVKVLTISDPSTTVSIAKLGAGIGLSAPPLESDCGILVKRGVSVRTTGTTPKAYLYYK